MEGFHGDRMMLFYHIRVLLHSSLSILPLGGTYIVLGFGVYLWALLNFGHRMFPARPMSSDDPKTLPKRKVGNQLLHEIWNFYIDGILKLLTILFIPKSLYFFLAPVHTYLKSTVNSVFHTLLCHIINNMSYFSFTTRRLHSGLQTIQKKIFRSLWYAFTALFPTSLSMLFFFFHCWKPLWEVPPVTRSWRKYRAGMTRSGGKNLTGKAV